MMLMQYFMLIIKCSQNKIHLCFIHEVITNFGCFNAAGNSDLTRTERNS